MAIIESQPRFVVLEGEIAEPPANPEPERPQLVVSRVAVDHSAHRSIYVKQTVTDGVDAVQVIAVDDDGAEHVLSMDYGAQFVKPELAVTVHDSEPPTAPAVPAWKVVGGIMGVTLMLGGAAQLWHRWNATEATPATYATAQAEPVEAAPVVLPEPSRVKPGTVGASYAAQLGGKGSEGWTWQIVSGSLPPGLTLNTNGHITGTPTAPGTTRFTVAGGDAHSSIEAPLQITIEGGR